MPGLWRLLLSKLWMRLFLRACFLSLGVFRSLKISTRHPQPFTCKSNRFHILHLQYIQRQEVSSKSFSLGRTFCWPRSSYWCALGQETVFWSSWTVKNGVVSLPSEKTEGTVKTYWNVPLSEAAKHALAEKCVPYVISRGREGKLNVVGGGGLSLRVSANITSSNKLYMEYF